MKSIRIFLVAGIVATLTLFNFVAALRGYQTSMEEADTLFDNQLLDLSQLVAKLDIPRINRDFRLGNNLMFQVWENGKLLTASYGAPIESMSQFVPGFDFSNFDGYRWRTFARLDEEANRWIIVAERTDLRFVLAENVVLESVVPILLGIPVAALLIWIIIGHGLKPLRLLSGDLRDKRVNDLSPLHYDNSPTELDQVVQSINSFIRRLSDALEREKRFSADAAHELRTPISALKLQLHNLEQEVVQDSDAMQQLQSGVERMKHLVEQLLSLYRSSPEQFAANCRSVDLHAITQGMIARLYPLYEARRQLLELEGEGPLPINGDHFALETMVANLLTNANKYSPIGGNVRLRVGRASNNTYLEVEDSGPGIPESERERIFERFYRSSIHEPGAIPGCGLGLTIVRHVADLHNASVRVQGSASGTGTIFRVDFSERHNAE